MGCPEIIITGGPVRGVPPSKLSENYKKITKTALGFWKRPVAQPNRPRALRDVFRGYR